MTSTCQQLLNTYDVLRALLKFSFNSPKSPVTHSHFIEDETETWRQSDLPREYKVAPRFKPTSAGKEGSRHQCGTLAEVLEDTSKDRTSEPLRTIWKVRGLESSGPSPGILCSLGQWHEHSRWATQHTGNLVTTFSFHLCLRLSHADSTDASCPAASPPSWRHLGPETWPLHIASSGAVPTAEDPLLTARPSTKVTPLGQQKAFLSLRLRWPPPPAEITHSTFWLYELIIKLEQATGWLAGARHQLLPLPLPRVTGMGKQRSCLIFPQQCILLS